MDGGSVIVCFLVAILEQAIPVHLKFFRSLLHLLWALRDCDSHHHPDDYQLRDDHCHDRAESGNVAGSPSGYLQGDWAQRNHELEVAAADDG